MSSISNRYSEADLAEFKALIEKRLEKANRQLDSIQAQLEEAADSKGSEGDWMDDSSSSTDMDMLYTMLHRQKKHILDLNNAYQRIVNKSYGICIATGELIDKRRLLAVPTTTKSMAAKLTTAEEPEPVPKITPMPRTRDDQPKVITRVIKKVNPNKPAPVYRDEDDDLLGDDDDELGLGRMDGLEGLDSLDGLDEMDGLDDDSDFSGGGGDIDPDDYSEEDLED